jgi:hypothetical protein
VLLFALVVAAFGGTAYAALRMLDTGPDVQTLREQRAQQQAAHERKRGKARKRANARRGGQAAGAPVAAAPSGQKRRPRRSWAARADALCGATEQDSLLLIERYPARTPLEILRLLDAAVRLASGLVGRIERLGPAPNRRLHARLMRELHASVAADRRSLEALRAHWNPAAVERLVQDGRRDRVIQRLFTRLGSPSCAGL